jgi:deazaflavin-dependent oxidoreductase (nitroreductase family)
MTEPLHDVDALNAFNAAVVEEFRANGGKVGGQFEGADLLLLTTTGAKSGRRRLNPLQYSRVDGAIIVVGAYAGADVHPAWVHNLRANPRALVEVGTRSVDVIARELTASRRRRADVGTRRASWLRIPTV